jgi:hypothetical protein
LLKFGSKLRLMALLSRETLHGSCGVITGKALSEHNFSEPDQEADLPFVIPMGWQWPKRLGRYNGQMGDSSPFATIATYAYDNNGNLTSAGNRTFSWNYNNLLSQVTGTGTSTYWYDHAGQSVLQIGGGATTTHASSPRSHTCRNLAPTCKRLLPS